MNNLKNVSMEELFEVLACGKEPIKGITLLEYMEEWNSRVKKMVVMKLLLNKNS